MMEEHNSFMERAIELAKEGMEAGKGGPFGSVVVKDGEIVGQGCNMVLATGDPTAHAEIVAIREASRRLGRHDLSDCLIYTSCEPCPMCLGAIYWARPKAVYFACTKDDAAAIGFDDSFIYEEIALPLEERKIKMQRLGAEEALDVFRQWEKKTGKKLY